MNWEYYVNGWDGPIRTDCPIGLDGFHDTLFLPPGPISRAALSPCCGAPTLIHCISAIGPGDIMECSWCRMGVQRGEVADGYAECWYLPDNMGGYYADKP